MKYLILSGVKHLSNSSIVKIAESCPKLTYLDPRQDLRLALGRRMEELRSGPLLRLPALDPDGGGGQQLRAVQSAGSAAHRAKLPVRVDVLHHHHFLRTIILRGF